MLQQSGIGNDRIANRVVVLCRDSWVLRSHPWIQAKDCPCMDCTNLAPHKAEHFNDIDRKLLERSITYRSVFRQTTKVVVQ